MISCCIYILLACPLLSSGAVLFRGLSPANCILPFYVPQGTYCNLLDFSLSTDFRSVISGLHGSLSVHDKAADGLANTMSATVLGDIVERKPGSTAPKTTGPPGSPSTTLAGVPTTTGFPKVHHRSQGLSAFALRRARINDERTQSSSSVPHVKSTSLNGAKGAAEKEKLAAQTKPGTDAKGDKGENEVGFSQNAVRTAERTTEPEIASFMKTKSTKGDNDAAWRQDMERQNEELVGRMDDKQKAQERHELVEQLGPGVVDLMNRIQERRAVPWRGPDKISDMAGPPRMHGFVPTETNVANTDIHSYPRSKKRHVAPFTNGN